MTHRRTPLETEAAVAGAAGAAATSVVLRAPSTPNGKARTADRSLAGPSLPAAAFSESSSRRCWSTTKAAAASALVTRDEAFWPQWSRMAVAKLFAVLAFTDWKYIHMLENTCKIHVRNVFPLIKECFAASVVFYLNTIICNIRYWSLTFHSSSVGLLQTNFIVESLVFILW